MDRKYRKILKRIDRGPLPVQFDGDEARFAAELIDDGLAAGDSVQNQTGVDCMAVATGLTFRGRCALNDSSFMGRVERVYDLLIGVAVGAVTGGLSTLLGVMLVKRILER